MLTLEKKLKETVEEGIWESFALFLQLFYNYESQEEEEQEEMHDPFP